MIDKMAAELELIDWIKREMPAGTVIGDPEWWASRIAYRARSLTAPRVPEETAAKIRGPYNACMFRETCCSLLTTAPAPAEQNRTALEQAHMAGQADAGIDPSYSSARAYADMVVPAPADDGPVASIDDIWVASGKEYDRSIHSNPDHYAWAELFVSTFPNLRADIDTMAGWFANAMMAKVDSMRAHTAEPAPADPESFSPNPECETRSDCRASGFCMDAWKCGSAAPADSDPMPMPLFTTTEGEEIKRLRERVKVLEDVLHKMIGVPASAGFCEPIEGYVKRPHDAVDVMREMAARLRGGSDE